MEKLVIEGNKTLVGEVTISGAKNSALALIPAALLINGVTTIDNVPNISDIKIICSILNEIGATVTFKGEHTITIDARNISSTATPLDMTSKFRASYYLLGSLLGRCHHGIVGLPGGCKLGVRPIDQHIKGANIYFDIISVGATINLILAATLAEGTTILDNCAKEPHIVDVANFLNSMGADIRGAGTDTIKINGVKELKGDHQYSVVPDQIEAGTFMLAAIASKGDILIKNCVPEHLDPLTAKIEEMGGIVDYLDDTIHVKYNGKIEPVNIKTLPYPGFPTDLQSQIGVVLALADGTSILTESIWDSRFQYTDELIKMGAHITASGKTAVFEGVPKLTAANLYASDLRAGAALVIAGLIAEGTSEVHNIHYIDRGYENIEDKFNQLGANIKRVHDDEEIR